MDLSTVEKGRAVAKAGAAGCVIALAGNPNVGKSTVFNALTGMNQHTGNWPGKTVASAQGTYRFRGHEYALVDLPGTYSLMAHSTEEEIARDFILFGGAEAVIVVCDATCLERNLNLALQVMEIAPKVIVCVNLLDEAQKKGIFIDLAALERELGVPVAGTSARNGKGLKELMEKTEALCEGSVRAAPRRVRYHAALAGAMAPLVEALEERLGGALSPTWLALRLLEGDGPLTQRIHARLGYDPLDAPKAWTAFEGAREALESAGISAEQLKDMVVSSIILTAEEVAWCMGADCKTCAACKACAACKGCACGGCARGNGQPAASNDRDRKLDRILTSKGAGIPIMLALLCVLFWLTFAGANVPSQILADALFWVQDQLTALFVWLGAPDWLHGALVLGAYRVLAWVVSVMLPPMTGFKKNQYRAIPLSIRIIAYFLLKCNGRALHKFLSRGGWRFAKQIQPDIDRAGKA